MAHHIITGKKGEELASAWLQKQAFTVLHLNWRYQRNEIDIIASKENTLHFIEVKTSRTDLFGHPEERVNRLKLKSMLRAGAAFQFANPGWKRVQYDVVSVMLDDDNTPQFFMIEDVYL